MSVGMRATLTRQRTTNTPGRWRFGRAPQTQILLCDVTGQAQKPSMQANDRKHSIPGRDLSVPDTVARLDGIVF